MAEPREPTPRRIDRRGSGKPWLKTEDKVGIGCFAALGIAVVVFVGATQAGPEPEPPDPWSAAERVCKNHVLDRLKSPSTAEFGEVDVSTSGPPYTVRGVVDAQNSFGATLRNSFSCTVTRGSSGWELVSFNLS